MSAALQTQRVKAHVAVPKRGATVTEVRPVTLLDGSLVLTPGELALLGNGDADAGRREVRALIANERDRTVFSGPVTEAPRSVRRGTAEDVPALVELLMLDIAENAARVAPPDPERVRAQVEAGLPDAAGMIGVIDGPDKKPVAVVVMVPIKWWWSQSYYYQEAVLFVHPEHRKGTRHLHDLLQFQCWFVDSMSKRFGYRIYMLCGVLGTVNVRRKIAVYRRKFRQCGSVHIYPSPFPGDTT